MVTKKNFKTKFPFFTHNPTIKYLDSAGTSQKPQEVIDELARWYEYFNAPAHRSTYTLAEQATEMVERVRAQCAQFINAASAKEIVFTRSTTDSTNMLANTWARQICKKNKTCEIVLTELEHHANILPWQQLSDNCVIKWLSVKKDGSLNLDNLESVVTKNTKLVCITGYSHVLGPIRPHDALKKIITRAHAVGARVLLDAAQLVVHQPIDVKLLQVDFLVFSAHKLFGPQGLGVLYAKEDTHEQFVPYQMGGGMAFGVTKTSAQWSEFPHMLEAGSEPTGLIHAFGKALSFIQDARMSDKIITYESELARYLRDSLQTCSGISLLAPQDNIGEASVITSFTVKHEHAHIHAHDVAAYLDQRNICVRAGVHCAQVLHDALGVPASVRVSLAAYNTHEDIDCLITALKDFTK